MQRVSTTSIRTWFTVTLIVTLVTSLGVWVLRRDRLPDVIRIATGESGGLYHRLGQSIASEITRRTDRVVEFQPTAGSSDNFASVDQRESNLGIIQGGPEPIEPLSVVTPLFPEFVFVICRKGSGIDSISDLAGKAVSLGPEGSGTRSIAMHLIDHFGVDPSELTQNNVYFKTLLNPDSTLDAAIVTSGIGSPDLRSVLATNDFFILPIHNAAAIEMIHPYLREAQIPRGLFSAHPPVPAESVLTVATIAYLVARPDASERLVQAALESAHEESLRLQVPTLISRRDAPAWISTRLHPVSQRYFYPTDHLGFAVNIMESLVATKELLFALGAGVYLLWMRWGRLKEAEAQAILSQQKERLDRLLEDTLGIERAQMETNDPVRLRGYMDSVTRIKIRALHEFTEEELRGDQSFAIFLNQCSGLIEKIQLKILTQK